MQIIKMVFATSLLLVWCIVMPLFYLLLKLFRIKPWPGLYLAFHKGCNWIFGLDLRVSGSVNSKSPSLFLSNHISYMDIFVLGSLIPGQFIAKSEVAKWPVLGKLAGLQNTLFFERRSNKVKGQIDTMTEHFNRDGKLILFPEGTSTNGEFVVPFKSSLLKSVEHAEKAVYIQPVTLAYTHYKDRPMTKQERDKFAWYDTMPFTSHFFTALGLSKARVEVIFHPLVTIEEFESRKDCAEHCYRVVETALLDTISELNGEVLSCQGTEA